jgi:hypothetical protein
LRFLVLLSVSLAAMLPLLSASAALPETSAVLAGAAFIKSIQSADGSYGTTSPGQNMDAVFAVRSAGYDPAKDLVGGKGPADYLKANAAAATSAASAAKAALGAKALGLDPKSVNGVDLIGRVAAAYNATKGTYAGDDFSQSIAILGLACTGNSVPAAAAGALRATQTTEGGWGFGGASDPDTTAIVVQALLAAGIPKTDAALTKALTYLKADQAADGGFGYASDTESNVSSTAFVVQALIALGENPESATYTKSGATPISYLLSQQNPDGSFKGFDAAFGTNQVLPALAGRTFCNAPETPITRTRPAAVATPTAQPTTAPPAAATPAPTTPAPAPPNAGNSAGADNGLPRLAVLSGLLLVLAAGGAAVSLRRRRQA